MGEIVGIFSAFDLLKFGGLQGLGCPGLGLGLRV